MSKTSLMHILDNSTCMISNGSRTLKKMSGVPILLWGLLFTPQHSETRELKKVDCFYATVGVNIDEAEVHKNDLMDFLEELIAVEILCEGVSYKYIAHVVGDDFTALRVLGLGQALGLWEIRLPDQFDIEPELVDEAADLDLIVATGYKPRNSVVKRAASC